MSTTEDKVRAILLGIATEIDDDSAPPLHLLADRPRRVSPLRRTLTPIAAAAALLVIAVATVTTTFGRHAHPQPVRDIANVPPYYVAIRAASAGKWSAKDPWAAIADAVVRSTASGATIATIAPPKPYITFVFVSAAADDRTFVLAAQRAVTGHSGGMNHVPPTRFYRLRVSPAAAPGQRARLTPLPVPVERTGTYISDVALSPDASKLAVISTAYPRGAHVSLAELAKAYPKLHVFTIATGRERTWPGEVYTWTGVVPQPHVLSWTADSRTLAMVIRTDRPMVRLIDTTAPPGSGVTTSAKAGFLATTDTWVEVVITPDGRALFVLRTNVSGTTEFQRLEEYSLGTGKRTKVLAVTRLPEDGSYLQVFWSSRSGRTLLVDDTGPGQRSVSVEIGRRDQVIPWSPRFITAAW